MLKNMVGARRGYLETGFRIFDPTNFFPDLYT
jgi:hypothetical protein